jgi:hypothetical protein
MKLRRNTIITTALVAGIGIGVILIGTASHAGPSAETKVSGSPASIAEVKAAVEKAVRVDQRLGLRAEVLPATPGTPTEADLQQQLTRDTAAIHDIFADGPAAQKEVDTARSAIGAQRTGDFRLEGAGIKDLAFQNIAIDPDALTATVQATVETWSRMSNKNPDGTWHRAEPHNIIELDMKLSKNDGRWLVEAYSWTFAPGSAP